MTTAQETLLNALGEELNVWVFIRDRLRTHQYEMRWTRPWTLARLAAMYGVHVAERELKSCEQRIREHYDAVRQTVEGSPDIDVAQIVVSDDSTTADSIADQRSDGTVDVSRDAPGHTRSTHV
ncbi:hypothetical protein SAMN05660199_01157 [Klenkia soli]|uniref:Uncharacterized protein n=1 Tax=Klenkia soli TaxID=1052260 RepID=A0A1H0G6W6_9ACTN|nr:hypothetical protein [Klenkia soli]SDO02628.1 hypothetical protein SAMN05660199_01157 [Klenkia soli]